MIEITAIRFAGGNDHEHITDVQWRSAATYAGLIPVPALISWLGANDANQAVVADGSGRVPVLVVRPSDQPPYIQARADGVWTDNLLTLPTFD
jgi:hypothetical protein